MNVWERAAYRRPKSIPKSGVVIDVGSGVGTRILQVMYVRLPLKGFRAGRGKR